MSDKRRKSRIQGGWAPKRNKVPLSKKPDVEESGNEKGDTVENEIGPKAESSHKFVFKPTVKEVKKKADVRIINTDGEYELSNCSNGLSKIKFLKNFIEPEEAEWMFEQLKSEIPWEEKEITVWGRKCLQPRLTAWFGDFPYTYSRLTLNPFKWSPLLNVLREKIKSETGLEFNSMLANLYRDNKDSVDWHSDDEKTLGRNPVIASLSFGDTRMFEMKRKPLKGEEDDDQNAAKVKIPLTDGSLLLMLGATQHDWLHRVGKEYHDRNPRINLTFRTIHSRK